MAAPVRLMHRVCGRPLRAVLGDRRGIAATEFAIIGGVLLTLVLAAYDLGSAVQQSIRLTLAVRAGGQYAVSFPTDATGINAAFTNALPSYLQQTTTSAIGCECVSGGAASSGACDLSATQASCDQCPAGTTERFVHVTASAPFSPFVAPFQFSAITSSSACYVARVQ